MKRISITVALAALALVASCGGLPQDIEETQGAVFGAVAPARPYGPLITGNLNGWSTLNTAPPDFPTRPNMGYPGWQGLVAFSEPLSVCTAPWDTGHVCLLDAPGMYITDQNGTHTLSPTVDRLGYGAVAFFGYDFRMPSASGFINAWENEIPLRSATAGLPQTGPAYVVSDLATTHMQDAGVGQLTLMIMDFYARVTFCTSPNLTGSCIQFGYNCSLSGGACHGDTACERDPNCTPRNGLTDINLLSYLQLNSSLYPHQSVKVEYGF
jgi:hypothetical protein